MTLDSLIKQYDNVSANLRKLDALWERMRETLQSAMSNTFVEADNIAYSRYVLDFERILTQIPAVNGKKLPNSLLRYSEVFQNHIDASEIGEIDAMIRVIESAHEQEVSLREYRHGLEAARRDLVRRYSDELLARLHELLERIAAGAKKRRPGTALRGSEWNELENTFRVFDRLLGDAIERPTSWTDFSRHLNFATKQDLCDIRLTDFPAVLNELPALLMGENDPLPVDITDFGSVDQVSGDATSLATQLEWSRITPEQFERLCQDIFAGSHGWRNPKWLLKTNAPDRGRDIEVEKVDDDPLMGVTTRRTIVQCKHYPNGTVGKDELATLIPQIDLLGRVDLLIVMTSGKFSDQLLQFTEQHNKKDRLPLVWLWSDWNLEQFLARRPDLSAQYRLR